MKKTIAVVAATLLCLCLLAGCASSELPGNLKADDLKAKAQAAGDAIVARDYEGFIALFDAATMEAAGVQMNAEDLAAFYDPILDKLGDFVEYSGLEAGPYKDANGTEYGVVLIQQKFANDSMSHTASFNLDGALVGFGITSFPQ